MRELLGPLVRFYEREGQPCPVIEGIDPGAMPEPYRQLLAHEQDMTPTLESFHGGEIYLRILNRIEEGDRLSREVVLELNGSGRAVEFGAIIIYLEYFPEAAREEILAGHRPLGAILARHSIAHHGRPQGYFALASDETINQAFDLEAGLTLYGRRNQILNGTGQILADVVEILPPFVLDDLSQPATQPTFLEDLPYSGA